ncbi:MAG: glycosyltransferase [Candidatus Aminicenantes bacterium]|nr:glycosyltransferase [Candidatus Aminicenantes bacterium]
MTLIYRPGRKKTGRPTNSLAKSDCPWVSILKPVKGVDDGLEANLESFYHLDYPVYEILFAVDNWQDREVEIIRKVADRHPKIYTRILATGHHPTENPKIHKLTCLESESRGSLLWVTDANVRVEPDTLRRLVAEYKVSAARFVFSPILGSASRTFASLMENTSLNFFTSGNVITLWKLFSKPVVVGKSMLIDRAALKTLGGFKYFKDYLAEDYLIGKSFMESGFRVSTDYTWVTNINQRVTIKSFYKRMARWARLRFQLHRPAYLSEILLNPMVLALASLLVVGSGFWWLVPLAVGFKIFLEYLNFVVVNAQDRGRWQNHLLFPLMVVTKDLIFLAVYLTPFFSSTVDWRGGRIKVAKNSLICHKPSFEQLLYEEA